MAYREKEFASCIFNPLVKGNMIENFPRLAEIILPEWRTAELDLIIRYVICAYDPKSPLVLNERDLNYRKGLAAELAGFDLSNEEFTTSIFTCTHEYLVDLIIKFLIRFIKSKEYAAIIIVEACFWESAKKLMEPISGKNSKEELEAVQKKSAIKDELDKDIARLDKYFKAFFGEDVELETKAKSRMTPESIGKLKQQ